MPSPKSAASAPLRERNHVRRKRQISPGLILGVRPWLLALGVLTLVALIWFLHGWLTYPIVPALRDH